jgi:hypothetical protein
MVPVSAIKLSVTLQYIFVRVLRLSWRAKLTWRPTLREARLLYFAPGKRRTCTTLRSGLCKTAHKV